MFAAREVVELIAMKNAFPNETKRNPSKIYHVTEADFLQYEAKDEERARYLTKKKFSYSSRSF